MKALKHFGVMAVLTANIFVMSCETDNTITEPNTEQNQEEVKEEDKETTTTACKEAPTEAKVFTGDKRLKTKAEFELFVNEGYTEITGKLTIGSAFSVTDIDDLSGLYTLQKVGSLELLALPINPEGLCNLTEISGSLHIGAGKITSLSGLVNLQKVGGDFSMNSITTLENFSDLVNLKSLGGLVIQRSSSIKNLKGLEGVSGIDKLQLEVNTHLEDISALSHIKEIAKIVISESPKLISLASLKVEKIDELLISNNLNLTGIKLSALQEITTRISLHNNSSLENYCSLKTALDKGVKHFYIGGSKIDKTKDQILADCN